MADASSRLSRRWKAVKRHLDDFFTKNLINLGAVAGVCLLLGTSSTWARLLGVAAALSTFVAIIWRRRKALLPPDRAVLGYFVTVRSLLMVAVGAGFSARSPGEAGWAWAGVGVAIMLVMAESLVKSLLSTTKVTVVNLPGVPVIPTPPFPPGWLTVANLALIAVGGVLAATGLPGWLLLALALASVPLTATIIQSAVRATLASKRVEKATRPALERYAPAFVVYYAAVHGVRYQLGMWLPYLERLEKPFIVITRNKATVPEIAKLTSAPILVPRTDRGMSTHLDSMVVPSLRAAFYVQGSPGNQTFQRYGQLTHVWLNHGDSDKQANFHVRHATYSKLFVSGQQGIDRYAQHGIDVPPERFVVVGRPQVEKIAVRDEPLPLGTPRTILYAPTWKGGRPSTNYSSLPVAKPIIQAVLDRGSTVIFRPHPLSYADPADAERIRELHQLLETDRARTGRTHVWGRQAEQDWDVPDCFNASDAVISDVSSIASDYLASGKPIAMVAVTAAGAAFKEAFPMARVCYVIEPDLSTLDQVLDHLHGDDPLAEARRAYRSYTIGDHVGPDAAVEFLADRRGDRRPRAPGGRQRALTFAESAESPSTGSGRDRD